MICCFFLYSILCRCKTLREELQSSVFGKFIFLVYNDVLFYSTISLFVFSQRSLSPMVCRNERAEGSESPTHHQEVQQRNAGKKEGAGADMAAATIRVGGNYPTNARAITLAGCHEGTHTKVCL